MKTIYTFFVSLFTLKPKTLANENGTCQRCSGFIAPLEACCILGYDDKKHSHPRDLCDQIICSKCTTTLGFSINAIHKNKNQSHPTVLFSKEGRKKIQHIADKM